MPRPAALRERRLRHNVFLRIGEEIQRRAGGARPPVALHVGDTWLDLPPELNAPLPEEPWAERLSRYGDTRGEIELRRRLVPKLAERNRLPVSDPAEVQITLGATGALFIGMRRLLAPGDEVLVLSPQWTILRAVARAAGVRMVEAPFFHRLAAEPGGDLAAWIEPHLTERTRALYFNSPNNPTGVLLHRRHLERLADLARARDLWVLSDEAYEDFVWSDAGHVSIGSLPGMFERTVSIYSFSKSYAGAGLRLGYAAAPAGVIAAINPGQVGVSYEPNRPAQVMGIRGLARREAVVPRLRAAYREGLDAALANIRVPHLEPEGAWYLFLDLRDRWTGLDDTAKLERMAAAGVFVSPGEAFGAAYDGWARFCFTSELPDLVAEAARRAADL